MISAHLANLGRLRKLGLIVLIAFVAGCSTKKDEAPAAPEPPKRDTRQYIAMSVTPAIGVSEWPGMSAKKVRKYSLIPALKQFHKTKRFKFTRAKGHKKAPAHLHLRVDLNGRYKTGELFMEVRFKTGDTYFITAKTELHGLTDIRVFQQLEKLSKNMAQTLIKDMKAAGIKL